MHKINLLDYADHSLKVPTKILLSAFSPRKSEVWKVALAHLIDLCIAISLSIVFSAGLSESVDTLHTSSQLKKIFQIGLASQLSIFSTILMGQFFFCYFFNHGQSFGLYLFEKRLSIKDKCFKQAFRWGIISFLTCLTGGLAVWFFNFKQAIATHDYLYQDLVSEKDLVVMKLIDHSPVEQEDKENYLQAA